MKRSQLHKIIKQEIATVLNEAVNPELDRTVGQFVRALAAKYQYLDRDAVMAIFEALKRLNMLDKSVGYKAPSMTVAEGSSYVEGQMNSDTKSLYQKYVQQIDIFDRNAIHDHNSLDKALRNDPQVQASSQKHILQAALGWAITFAQEAER